MRERGFTLLEVMVALVILAIAILGIAQTTASMVHTVAVSSREQAAVQLVEDRIELIRVDPNYAGLDSTYAKTENSFATLPGFTRTTTVTQVGGSGQTNDYKMITVKVTGPGLSAAVSRTITVAAP